MPRYRKPVIEANGNRCPSRGEIRSCPLCLASHVSRCRDSCACNVLGVPLVAGETTHGEFSMQHFLGRLLCCLSMLLLAACGGGGGGSSAPPQTSVAVAPTMANVMVGQQIQLIATVKDRKSV